VRRLRYAFPQRIHKVKSHASLPFEQAPRLIAELRKQNTVKSLAMQFIMLNAVRVGDIVGGGKRTSSPMKWSHVDLTNKLWVIPDTKMGHEHHVPLSDPAMRVLAEMQHFRDPSTDFVFPGSKSGSCLNDATLRYLLRDMGYTGRMTVHGARSMFKTWAEEQTNHPVGVVEAALAHVKDGLTAAYHRGSYLQKRRVLMQQWADYLEGRGAQVIQLQKRA
jgi:integrase